MNPTRTGEQHHPGRAGLTGENCPRRLHVMVNSNKKKIRNRIVDAVFFAVVTIAIVSGFRTTVLPPRFSDWHKVVVQPGQSLWSICVSNCPQADTRIVIDAVCQRDHIVGNKCIQPGQVLYVPTRVS